MKVKRKGIAIVAALGGIVVIGALIAGVFFVSTQESQISRGSLVSERAFHAAELGLNTTLYNWDAPVMYALPVGTMTTTAYAGTGWVDTVVITKLTTYGLVGLAVAVVPLAALWHARRAGEASPLRVGARSLGLVLGPLLLMSGFPSWPERVMYEPESLSLVKT